MRSESGAQQVICRVDIRHPIAKSLIDRIFQCSRTRINAANFGSEQPHSKDIQLLPPHVFGAHVDDTFQPETRADSSGSNAVLPGACLGDDPFLAHPPGQQDLPDTIIYLVGAGVIQVFAF